jgi:ribosomal protein S27E
MRQTAEVKVESYRSVCCDAALDRAVFSDGRGFVICSACGKVLAVEPKRERKRA